MKVAIVTQPLLNNYGALLQNYALQQVLKKYGCVPITIDYHPIYNFYSEFVRVFCSWLKTLCLRVFGNEYRPFAKFHQIANRLPIFDEFVSKYISKTEIVVKYSKDILKKTAVDAVVVGSDQVWRPSMNLCLEDMYLKFAKNESIHKRIAYSASFGIDKWEYTPTQTEKCSALVKMFNAVSVREESGVELCKKNFDIDVTWVLDPTLLLEKSDYMKLCEQIPVHLKNYLAVYVLDMNDSIRKMCDEIASEKGLVMKFFSADASAILSVPEWLAMFRDASYIITDSFHGTVFSIIFGKEFKCFYNKKRGAARFKSLLGLYNSEKIEEMRDFSLNWLKNALQ